VVGAFVRTGEEALLHHWQCDNVPINGFSDGRHPLYKQLEHDHVKVTNSGPEYHFARFEGLSIDWQVIFFNRRILYVIKW